MGRPRVDLSELVIHTRIHAPDHFRPSHWGYILWQ
jgi:hypothetical protein